MKITDKLAARQTFSFEIFPPKGDLPLEKAYEVASALAQDRPDWVSVTYSAGGSGNSENTVPIAASLERDLGVTALAHLTCLGSTKADVDAYVAQLHESGVQNVLALRGDRRPGREAKDFSHASDLITYLRVQDPDLCIGAACYPEGHVESPDVEESYHSLYLKQEAGADYLVTQLFFDNEDFYRFRDMAAKAGVSVPVTCGIMPFMSKSQVSRMIFMCGASLPSPIIRLLAKYEGDDGALRQAGIDYAAAQLRDLRDSEADGLHVYAMNRPEVARQLAAAVRS